jgi:hypothetical protein
MIGSQMHADGVPQVSLRNPRVGMFSFGDFPKSMVRISPFCAVLRDFRRSVKMIRRPD